ncbi:hypothetical protein ACQ5SO_03545 [Rhodovulum sp. DZ06]|uniref:hypothetical protein n=1 Tax=Rhodovulum sp. DZ06 TaxID=3425126 RepID=UPI003D34E626
MTRSILTLGLLSALALGACAPAGQHAAEVTPQEEKLTVGTVQREIREGMTGGEVAAVLGAPNVVSSIPGGGETWIYDRISTQRAYSQSAGGVNVLFLGAGQAAGAASVSQRTLTVIIKYDAQGRVSDFSYRQSSF